MLEYPSLGATASLESLPIRDATLRAHYLDRWLDSTVHDVKSLLRRAPPHHACPPRSPQAHFLDV